MNATETYVEVWQLPCLSQEFEDFPALTMTPNYSLLLTYDFETPSGKYDKTSITFRDPEAFCFTGADSCSIEQIDSYDKLIEVVNSKWLRKLQDGWAHVKPGLKHYRIFFDDIGCYDIIATEFVAPD